MVAETSRERYLNWLNAAGDVLSQLHSGTPEQFETQNRRLAFTLAQLPCVILHSNYG
jgi:hypothetical protein